tara:strand:- start:2529 stop:3674 length:1146 start_codon:yes stop_codon:yes gene_type:complete
LEIWKSLFKSQWSPFIGALLIGFVNTMMFAFESPWSVFAGLRNWGLHLLEFIPNFPDVAQISPLEHTSSVMDIAFLLGAFGSALLAKEFSIRIPPLKEAMKGIIGGILMGIGANFARGCTIGGFYSSISALSVSGLYMMLGLFIGTIVGLKYVIWDMGRPEKKPAEAGTAFYLPPMLQIFSGLFVIIAGLLLIPYYYDYADLNVLGVIFCLAVILGVINQRSRFCFVRAFREPFMTGEGEMTKAAVAAFLVCVAGFSILKFSEIRDFTVHVAPSAGLPAVIGGFIFAIGMVIAGGCASGSLWRAGEGHVKLWLAVLAFALSAAGTHVILQIVFEYSYFKRGFLPDIFNSWLIALLFVFGIMYLWYWLAAWNETTEKLVMLK